jgi:hypothetical protein
VKKGLLPAPQYRRSTYRIPTVISDNPRSTFE